MNRHSDAVRAATEAIYSEIELAGPAGIAPLDMGGPVLDLPYLFQAIRKQIVLCEQEYAYQDGNEKLKRQLVILGALVTHTLAVHGVPDMSSRYDDPPTTENWAGVWARSSDIRKPSED